MLEKKISKKTGWCANYMQDKGYNEITPKFALVLFMLITRPIVEHKEITLLNLNLANVVLVNNQMHFTLISLHYLVTNNGRKKSKN